MAVVSNKKIRNWIVFIGLIVFIITIPYRNRYSNIGIITLSACFVLSINKTHITHVVKQIPWLLLLVYSVIFFLGLLGIKEGLIDKYYERIGKAILLLGLPFLLSIVLDISHKLRKYIIFSFAFSVLWALIMCYFWAFLNIDKVENPFNYTEFTKGMGGTHPVYLSMFAVFSFFIFLEGVFQQKKKSIKAFYILCSVFILLSVIVLNARAPLIGLILSLSTYIALKGKQFVSLKFILQLASIVVLAITLFAVLGTDRQLILMKSRLFDNFVNGLSFRLQIWNCGLEILNENSIWFGVGSGNVQALLNECYKSNFLTRPYFDTYNIHNEYLLIILRNGVFGILSWLTMLLYAFIKSLKTQNLLSVVFLVNFSICLFTEVYLHRIWGVLFFGAFYSLLIVLGLNINEKEDLIK